MATQASTDCEISSRISIHATHTGGDVLPAWSESAFLISIHATHTGGDVDYTGAYYKDKISIHATHTGGDFRHFRISYFIYIFQSTPPIRVATVKVQGLVLELCDFNPRHPYGWRPAHSCASSRDKDFNPRHPYGWRRNRVRQRMGRS